jgi:hypothetical protein
MTEGGQNLIKIANDLSALRDEIALNQQKGEDAFNTIIHDADTFNHYVTNVDQLRIFVFVFSGVREEYRQKTLEHVLTEPVFSRLINDTDALLQLARIFNSEIENRQILQFVFSDPMTYNRVIPNNESHNIVLHAVGKTSMDFIRQEYTTTLMRCEADKKTLVNLAVTGRTTGSFTSGPTLFDRSEQTKNKKLPSENKQTSDVSARVVLNC